MTTRHFLGSWELAVTQQRDGGIAIQVRHADHPDLPPGPPDIAAPLPDGSYLIGFNQESNP